VTLSTDLGVGAAPPERAGAAAGISETGAELGGALGIALLGSIGAAVYRSEGTGATLGDAVNRAHSLPAGAIDTATQAFTHGMQLAAVVSAILMVALAAVASRFLREPDAASDLGPVTVMALEPCS
jgi:DHA2 family multidrug resistance protein-like MFS transporter